MLLLSKSLVPLNCARFGQQQLVSLQSSLFSHSSVRALRAGFVRQIYARNSTLSRPNQLFQNVVRRFAASEAAVSEATLARRQKIIGYWLAGCAGLTFATVCAGGITRLTESGLSMVDWHPFKEIPPKSKEDWEAEFEKYKQFPEWKVKNREITLEQFKFIWHMEYGHRSLGRIIGAAYFLPMAAFWFDTLQMFIII